MLVPVAHRFDVSKLGIFRTLAQFWEVSSNKKRPDQGQRRVIRINKIMQALQRHFIIRTILNTLEIIFHKGS